MGFDLQAHQELRRLSYQVNCLVRDFCCRAKKCIGISNTGDPNLVLNQQGDWITSGGGSTIFITKTKAEIDTLISTNSLILGATYEIMGVHPTLYNDGTNSGTTIYLKAISTNGLEKIGTGKFYNPKYNNSTDGFGIWDNKMYGTITNVVGDFNFFFNETVTTNTGATGLLLTDGMIKFISGDWINSTSITGDQSGATANISDFTEPTYSIGSTVIFGGYSWTNLNGNVGENIDVLTLNSEWQKNVYSTSDYNITYDLIEYDITQDWITRRYDSIAEIDVVYPKTIANNFAFYGMIYHAIAVQQWGNPITNSGRGVGFKTIQDSYDESVNFIGENQFDIKMRFSSFQRNITFGIGCHQQSITCSNNSHIAEVMLDRYAIFSSTIIDNASYIEIIRQGYGTQFSSIYLINNSQITFTRLVNGEITRLNLSISQFSIISVNSQIDNILLKDNSIFSNIKLMNAALLNIGLNKGTLDFGGQIINQGIHNATFELFFGTPPLPSLATATLIYDVTLFKNIYTRPDGAIRLSYMDNLDTLTVTNITN